MTLLALTGIKGSPGATTAALTLAATWARPPLLIDADPAGGDLAVKVRTENATPIDVASGLVALTADLRHDAAAASDPGPYIRTAAGGLPVIAGFASSDQAAAAADRWPRLLAAIASFSHGPDSPDVIVDSGRLSRSTPTLELMLAATVITVVTRIDLASLTHLRRELRWLLDPGTTGSAVPVSVLPIVDPRRTSTKDLSKAIATAQLPRAVTTLPPLAWSPRDVAVLDGGHRGRLGGTLLIRTARASGLELARLAATVREEDRCPTPTPIS